MVQAFPAHFFHVLLLCIVFEHHLSLQLVPMKKPVVWERFVTFQGPSSMSFAFPLQGGLTMELTIAQFWSSGSGSQTVALADIEVLFLCHNVKMFAWFA